MNDVDPYAAPAELKETPEVDERLPWQVIGKVLLFRDGAHLPPIDLYTGRDDIELTTSASSFSTPRSKVSACLVGLMCAGLLVLLFSSPNSQQRWEALGWMKYPIMFAVIFLVSTIGRRSFSLVQLSYYISVSRMTRRKRINLVMILGLVSGFAINFGLSLTDFGSFTLILGVVLGVVVFLLAVFVFMHFTSLRLRCSATRDGWFELRGIPDAAIGMLLAAQLTHVRELSEEDEAVG